MIWAQQTMLGFISCHVMAQRILILHTSGRGLCEEYRIFNLFHYVYILCTFSFTIIFFQYEFFNISFPR